MFFNPELELCPVGTIQSAPVGTTPSPLTITLDEFQDETAVETIEECQAECCANDECVLFLWDDGTIPEDFPVPVGTLCFLYDEDAVADTTQLPSPPLGNILIDAVVCETESCPTVLECPPGTNQVGNIGQEVEGQLVGEAYHKTIEECVNRCKCNEDCFTITFDDEVTLGSGSASYCALWQVVTSGAELDPSSESAEQITCEVQSCPDGSTQVGSVGTAFIEGNALGSVITGVSPALCLQECENTAGCVAFTYDYDRWTNGYYDRDASQTWWDYWDNACYLYDSADIAGDEVDPIARDALSCEIDAAGSSAKSGYLDFEAITHKAGDGATDYVSISVYIIYGVIGLVLV
eukprot:CAMPEP_0201568896 /NCGR_PEP_ID=MMETSP0190_2-20130828/10217_1 /ASSEMBLY_ACC=CAM_ASM_000263 /TAXON_ID=37353 /ORGANISM="Rosalina sp." /LENGTH=349 /DNA_ID=CAMNT_0047990555 /DNA_START=385 /DNA_END=1431 /DNA_ORIENTATION=+